MEVIVLLTILLFLIILIFLLIEALRSAFGTSAWTEMEEDEKKFPIGFLTTGREKLATILKEKANAKNSK